MNPTILKFPTENTLTEIMQQNKTQFALCRFDERENALIQCHQFVHCRDFMHDALVSVESGRDMAIYGFTFDQNNPRPDPECVSLLLKFPAGDDGQTLKNFQDNWDILTQIEDTLGYAHSVPELVAMPEAQKSVVVWVLGDNMWQSNAVAFSLYTYLLKCIGFKFKNKSKWMEEVATVYAETNEGEYMEKKEWIQWLLNGGLDVIYDLYTTYSGFKDQEHCDCDTIHDCSGFVNVGETVWYEEKQTVGGWWGQGHPHVLDGFRANEYTCKPQQENEAKCAV